MGYLPFMQRRQEGHQAASSLTSKPSTSSLTGSDRAEQLGASYSEAHSSIARHNTSSSGSSESSGSSRTLRPDTDACPSRCSTHMEKGVQLGSSDDDVVWVTWDGPDDPENPVNWTRFRKWIITILISLFTFITAFAVGSYSITIPEMSAELNVSREVGILSLSLYPLGFGIAPLLLAPFSEVFGRWSMYLVTFAVHSILYLPSATAQNITAVLVTRFLQGMAGSSGSTMVGGTLADMWRVHERGMPMSFFSAAAFCGTGLGPATMGYVEQNLGWRWVIWIQLIFSGVVGLGFVLFLRETRGSVILSRRAARLRRETGSERYKCKADEERASISVLFKVSLMRPLVLLFTEPVVGAYSAWVGFAWGVLYGLLEAVPIVTREVYHFSVGQAGLAQLSMVVGGLLGVATNRIQERLYSAGVRKRGPEARLYFAMIGAVLLPAGGIIFAFSQGRGHWIWPLLGVVIVMMGIFHIYVAGFNYLADSYSIYASSAIAGQSFTRNTFGAAFPLFTSQVYYGLGFQWAAFLFSMVALALASVPFLLFIYGKHLRARSKFAQSLIAAQLVEDEANEARERTKTSKQHLDDEVSRASIKSEKIPI